MTMNDFSPDASQVAEVGSQAELTLRALQIAFYCAVQRSNNACWTQNSAKKLMYVDFSLQAKLTFREISEEARGMSVLDRAVVFLGRLIFINGSTYGLGVNLMICLLAVFIRRLHVFSSAGAEVLIARWEACSRNNLSTTESCDFAALSDSATILFWGWVRFHSGMVKEKSVDVIWLWVFCSFLAVWPEIGTKLKNEMANADM